MRSPLAAFRDLRRQVKDELRRHDVDRANRLRKSGRYAESRERIDRALRRSPDDELLLRLRRRAEYAREENRAVALWGEGRTDDAITAMHGLAERWPDDPDPHLWLAAMETALERFEVAATHARVALVAAPDDPVVALRSVSTIRRVDVAAARELLEASKVGLQSRGSLRDAFRPDVDHADGLLACDEGRIDAGIAHFEAAFATEPDGVGYGADLALAYLHVGRNRNALDVIAKALEHQPGNQRLLELERRALESEEGA